jgi:hypothetical protein
MKINQLNKLKTNEYGAGHMVIILILLVVAIIGVAGFAVFNSSNIKKTSAGYTTLGSNYGITVSACKTYNPVYGGIYTVKVLFTKAASTPAYAYDIYDINGITYATSQVTHSNAYYAGTVASYTINMSVVNKDYIYISAPTGIKRDYEIIPGTRSLIRLPGLDGFTLFHIGINNTRNC